MRCRLECVGGEARPTLEQDLAELHECYHEEHQGEDEGGHAQVDQELDREAYPLHPKPPL